MMSIEDFNRLRTGGDPQRVYGVGETPTDIADRFISEIDRVLDEPLG